MICGTSAKQIFGKCISRVDRSVAQTRPTPVSHRSFALGSLKIQFDRHHKFEQNYRRSLENHLPAAAKMGPLGCAISHNLGAI